MKYKNNRFLSYLIKKNSFYTTILIVILLGFENGGVFCKVLSCNYIIAKWFIINSIGNERAGCNNYVVSDFIYIYIYIYI